MHRLERLGGIRIHGQMQTALIIILWVLSLILALFIGGFWKSYMAKKGENLATHEDIDKLVEQVSAVTKATKDIEAKISSEVWDRQRRWDLKRAVPTAIVSKPAGC